MAESDNMFASRTLLANVQAEYLANEKVIEDTAAFAEELAELKDLSPDHEKLPELTARYQKLHTEALARREKLQGLIVQTELLISRHVADEGH